MNNIRKLLLLVLFFIPSVVALSSNVIVTDYGAQGDGVTMNTSALQQAIDACAESGGGEVVVPPGRFLTGTIYLRSHVELVIQRGATILGSTNVPADYPVRTLIYAEGIEDAGISGQGIIDGQARHPDFIARGFVVNDNVRPLGIHFQDCRNMSIRDIQLRDIDCWTIRLFRCDGVRIDNISIYCLLQGNNDGIDVDAKNVTITNCLIESDDDGICLKSDDPDFMPENITVSNCVIASNCNPIKMGTASLAGFRNVVMNNIVIRRTTESNVWDWSTQYDKVKPGTKTGLSGIAIESTDGGLIEHLSFSNIVMEGIITPIFIYMGDRSERGTGVIRDIDFSNIKAVCEGIIPCLISGMPNNRITHINMRDITVEHQGGEAAMTEALPENISGYPENRMFGRKNPAGGLYVRHADHLFLENFRINQRETDHRPVVVVDDVSDMHLNDFRATGSDAAMVQNNNSSDIFWGEKEIK